MYLLCQKGKEKDPIHLWRYPRDTCCLATEWMSFLWYSLYPWVAQGYWAKYGSVERHPWCWDMSIKSVFHASPHLGRWEARGHLASCHLSHSQALRWTPGSKKAYFLFSWHFLSSLFTPWPWCLKLSLWCSGWATIIHGVQGLLLG